MPVMMASTHNISVIRPRQRVFRSDCIRTNAPLAALPYCFVPHNLSDVPTEEAGHLLHGPRDSVLAPTHSPKYKPRRERGAAIMMLRLLAINSRPLIIFINKSRQMGAAPELQDLCNSRTPTPTRNRTQTRGNDRCFWPV